MHQENQDNDSPNFDSATAFHELVPDCRNLIFGFVFHRFTTEDLASFEIKNATPESISNLKFALNYFNCHASLGRREGYLPMPDLYSLSLPSFYHFRIPLKPYFGHFNHLVELDLFDDGNFTEEIFQHLGSLEVLTLFADAGFNTLSDEIFTHLKQLRQLEISCCGELSDEAFKNLYNAGSRLEKLDIMECDNITDQAFSFIEGKSLRELSLFNCLGITGVGLKHVRGVKRLHLKDMYHLNCCEVFKCLKGSAECLDIYNCCASSFGEKAMSYLKGISTLKLNRFQNHNLTDASFVHLEGSIKNLELNRCLIKGSGIQSKNMLWYLSGIEHVKLIKTGIRIEADDLPRVKEIFRNVVSCEVSSDFADESTLEELREFIEGNGGSYSCKNAEFLYA